MSWPELQNWVFQLCWLHLYDTGILFGKFIREPFLQHSWTAYDTFWTKSHDVASRSCRYLITCHSIWNLYKSLKHKHLINMNSSSDPCSLNLYTYFWLFSVTMDICLGMRDLPFLYFVSFNKNYVNIYSLFQVLKQDFFKKKSHSHIQLYSLGFKGTNMMDITVFALGVCLVQPSNSDPPALLIFHRSEIFFFFWWQNSQRI